MARLIKAKNQVEEGAIFNRWLNNRLIRNNKNVLTVITGATGSGKSYQDLRRAELWYQYQFNKKFPPENICFSIAEVMKRISTGKLKKGEILIFEEAGANLGSLDFHNKLQKMFAYVLQTFRSLNIGIFFNLPYLDMLNKSARTLIHVHFQTMSIDHKNKMAKSKAFFRQVNQSSGKIYNKYLRVSQNGRTRTVKAFNYGMPSEYLIDVYEQKKLKFVTDFTEDFALKAAQEQNKDLIKQARPNLTTRQQEVYDRAINGMTVKEMAKEDEVTERSILYVVELIRKKGYVIKMKKKP